MRGAWLLLAVVSCTAQDLIQAPRVAVQGARVVGLALDKVDLSVDLVLDNPHPLGFAVEGIDFKVYLADIPVLEGRSGSGVQIHPAGKTTLSVPLSIPLEKALLAVRDLKGVKELGYRVEGGITVLTTKMGKVRLPFKHEDKFPVPILPPLTVDEFAVDKVGLQSAKLRLKLGIMNPNVFAISKIGGTLKLTLGGADAGEILAGLDRTLQPGEYASISVAAELKLLSVLPRLLEKEIVIRLAGDLGATTPFGPIKLPVAVEQRIPIRR